VRHFAFSTFPASLGQQSAGAFGGWVRRDLCQFAPYRPDASLSAFLGAEL
jgi:hypothetical protein